MQNFLADFRLLRRDVLRIEADLDSHERRQEGVETVVAVDVSAVSARQSPTFHPVEFVLVLCWKSLAGPGSSRIATLVDVHALGSQLDGWIEAKVIAIGSSVLLKVTWLVATI